MKKYKSSANSRLRQRLVPDALQLTESKAAARDKPVFLLFSLFFGEDALDRCCSSHGCLVNRFTLGRAAIPGQVDSICSNISQGWSTIDNVDVLP